MSDSEKAKACLSKIVDLFKQGNVPEALAVVTIPPQTNIPSAKWSLGNRILQFLADTSDARGFRQWQEAGRQVKKGSKAFHILGPKARTITEKDEKGDKIEKHIVMGFFAIPVFRAEDTDGEPLPYYLKGTNNANDNHRPHEQTDDRINVHGIRGCTKRCA